MRYVRVYSPAIIYSSNREKLSQNMSLIIEVVYIALTLMELSISNVDEWIKFARGQATAEYHLTRPINLVDANSPCLEDLKHLDCV